MYKIGDFIRWALTHAKPSTIPAGAKLPLQPVECGAEPWQYLFGSVRVQTTQATLDAYYKSYYSSHGWTRERYDAITRNWDRNGYATDCQGLCDAYLTYACNDPTDINANMNFDYWCTDRGRIDDINRGWVLGEAVFRMNAEGRMTHIGWVCGFDGCEPLVIEAKGILYGVVVTRLYEGSWTHRGLMTKNFDYTEVPKLVRFEVTSPMQTGKPFSAMQDALNLAGYTDGEGKLLDVDGKWGRRSQQAFDKLIADYAIQPEPAPEPLEVFDGVGGKYRLVLEYK